VLEFKDIAPFLGILLPAIGAIFMYRQAERQRAREVDKAVQSAPFGVVAAITDKDAGVQMAASIESLADAVRKAVAIMREERDDAGKRRQADRAIDEITALRRELGEIVHLLKHRQD
jgi:hypothetical protein